MIWSMFTPLDSRHPPAAPSAERPMPPRAARWIPVRRLSARHARRLLAHLQALSPHDRYLRFGYVASDEQLARHVETMDFERDQVLGVFDRRLRLVATAHLAFAPGPAPTDGPQAAEFGVSVLESHRGRRLGVRLFEQAVLHARNRAIDTLYIHALSENIVMLKIAQRAGATVERDGAESRAWLKLPPQSVASQVDQLLGRQVAEIDYRWKRQAKRLQRWTGLMLAMRRRWSGLPGRLGNR